MKLFIPFSQALRSAQTDFSVKTGRAMLFNFISILMIPLLFGLLLTLQFISYRNEILYIILLQIVMFGLIPWLKRLIHRAYLKKIKDDSSAINFLSSLPLLLTLGFLGLFLTLPIAESLNNYHLFHDTHILYNPWLNIVFLWIFFILLNTLGNSYGLSQLKQDNPIRGGFILFLDHPLQSTILQLSCFFIILLSFLTLGLYPGRMWTGLFRRHYISAMLGEETESNDDTSEKDKAKQENTSPSDDSTELDDSSTEDKTELDEDSLPEDPSELKNGSEGEEDSEPANQ